MSMDDPIADTVSVHTDALKDLALRIHANPELGLAEHQAARWQVELLERLGFDVTAPFGGLETAYRAVRGSGKPVVCFLAEYDALPGIGHGCGHNLVAPVAIGAGAALSDALHTAGAEGTVVVLGTPAEEGHGGKVTLVEAGAFEDVDLALMAHPSKRTSGDLGRLAVVRREVSFAGRAAHAAAYPELGRNALDAVMLLFAGVNAWRQHLPDACRVHGIVTDGGDAPNIVPAHAACRFYLRAPDEKTLSEMLSRFERIAEGAGLMTATEATVSAGGDSPYKAGRVNRVLGEAFLEIAEQLDMDPKRDPGRGRGSSDFGNVSAVVPGAHYYFRITDEPTPSHSEAFARAAASELALGMMLKTAQALARVGARFCTDADFRDSVTTEFAARAAG